MHWQLSVLILLLRRFFPYSPFIYLFIKNLSSWTLGYLFHSLGNNPLLSLFILLLKLYQYWPLGAPSCWLLCPFNMSPSVFQCVLDFWDYNILGSFCAFPAKAWGKLFVQAPVREEHFREHPKLLKFLREAENFQIFWRYLLSCVTTKLSTQIFYVS